MSKYDQLDYVSRFEMANKTYPEYIETLSKRISIVPDELLAAITVDQFKKCLKLETQKQIRNFSFFNKNQSMITNDYFKNANYFRNEMSPDEKKDFLIDYLIYNFNDKVDGNYFKTNLTKIFKLSDKNYNVEDFNSMIKGYFQKDIIDLNDEEDRKKFKEIIDNDIQISYDNNSINNLLNSSRGDNI